MQTHTRLFRTSSSISGAVSVALNRGWHPDLPSNRGRLRSAEWGLWFLLILRSLWNLDLCVGRWTYSKKWLAAGLSLSSFTTGNTVIFPKYFPCHILLFCFCTFSVNLNFSQWLESTQTTCLFQFAVAGLVTGLGFWNHLKLFLGERRQTIQIY